MNAMEVHVTENPKPAFLSSCGLGQNSPLPFVQVKGMTGWMLHVPSGTTGNRIQCPFITRAVAALSSTHPQVWKISTQC